MDTLDHRPRRDALVLPSRHCCPAQEGAQPGEARLDDLIAELDRTVTTLEAVSGGPGPANFCG